MKALAILNRSPASKIEATQLLLTAAEARIAQLDGERDAALIGDSAEEIIRIDRLLADQRAAAVIHRDRIAALQVDVRRQAWQRAERERNAAIERVLVPFEAECADMAAEMEKAIGAAVYLFERLESRRAQILENWPREIPHPRFYSLHFSYLQRELFQSYTGWSGADFIRNLKSRLPKIADSVRNTVAGYIKHCRDVSIVPAEFAPPAPPDDDEEEAAA